MHKQRVSMTIDPDLLKRIKALAEKEKRSFSSMVSILVDEAASKKEKAA